MVGPLRPSAHTVIYLVAKLFPADFYRFTHVGVEGTVDIGHDSRMGKESTLMIGVGKAIYRSSLLCRIGKGSVREVADLRLGMARCALRDK